MKKFICTTTINPPTTAIKKFEKMTGWDLVVTGDLKTPNYPLEKGTYLSPQEQEKRYPKLSEAIGWNCIQRRNIAILYAYEQGADVIAVVDDDNIPLDHWGREMLLGQETTVNYYQCHDIAFDSVGATNAFPIWHRGFPLTLLSKRNYSNASSQTIIPDIQADLWNGDPDTDAIARMIYAPDVTMDEQFFPLASNAFSPFNSQNTFISRKWIKDYFLFPGIGRMDDIWASYYLQSLGAKVLFNKPSVLHARNEHDLLHDNKLEQLGHEKTLMLLQDIKKDPQAIWNYLPNQAKKAFEIYLQCF